MLYTPIDQLENYQDQVNIYGVVVDAALPYHTKDNNRYICTLKLIDHTYNTLGVKAQDTYKYLNCIFYAKRIEDCP
jgi:hypothetical protein